MNQHNCGIVYGIDSHPMDSRIRLQDPDEPVQTGQQVADAHMFENHAHDSRYTGPLEVAQTVSQLFGTDGNNTPLIVEVTG